VGCLRWFRTFEGGAITQPPKSENGHALPGSVGLSQFHCGGLVLAGGFRASHGFSSFQAPRSRCRWGCGCSFFLLPLNGAAVVSVFDVPLPVDFLLRRRGIDGGLWGGLLFLLGPLQRTHLRGYRKMPARAISSLPPTTKPLIAIDWAAEGGCTAGERVHFFIRQQALHLGSINSWPVRRWVGRLHA
jgi:hypothetical protein